jgi:hypothetical protein
VEEKKRAEDDVTFAETISQNRKLRETCKAAKDELSSRKGEMLKCAEECENERRKRMDVESRFLSLNREFIEKEEKLREDVGKLRIALSDAIRPKTANNFRRFLAGKVAEVAAEVPEEISSWLKSLIEALLVPSEECCENFKKKSLEIFDRKSDLVESFQKKETVSVQTVPSETDKNSYAERRNAFLNLQVRDLQMQVEALTLQPGPRVLNVPERSSIRISPIPSPTGESFADSTSVFNNFSPRSIFAEDSREKLIVLDSPKKRSSRTNFHVRVPPKATPVYPEMHFKVRDSPSIRLDSSVSALLSPRSEVRRVVAPGERGSFRITSRID